MKRFCLSLMLMVALGCLQFTGCGKPKSTTPNELPPVVQQMNIQQDPADDSKPADTAPNQGDAAE